VGAVLIDAVGRRVMLGVHPLADLAPRDVVAAGMVARMAQAPEGIDDHLWLDATALDRRLLTRRFPTVLARCREAGIDPVSDPIPVAPAAHYACGGLLADLDGCTTVPGLFAVGEVACTGVHGANRLASNSLTEALVAGRRAGREVSRSPSVGSVPVEAAAARSPDRPGTVAPSSRALTAALTSRYAGMLRDAAGLAVLLEHLGRVAVSDTPAGDLATIEATNLHTVSSLVAAAAAARLESRGCHRRSDAPNARTEWQAHLLGRIDDGAVLLERGACRAAA
jgi:L-aspartate oxidase